MGIPEFGTNFVRGMVEETHQDHEAFTQSLPQLSWSRSLRYRRVNGWEMPSRLDQGQALPMGIPVRPLSGVGTTSCGRVTSCTRVFLQPG